MANLRKENDQPAKKIEELSSEQIKQVGGGTGVYDVDHGVCMELTDWLETYGSSSQAVRLPTSRRLRWIA